MLSKLNHKVDMGNTVRLDILTKLVFKPLRAFVSIREQECNVSKERALCINGHHAQCRRHCNCQRLQSRVASQEVGEHVQFASAMIMHCSASGSDDSANFRQ